MHAWPKPGALMLLDSRSQTYSTHEVSRIGAHTVKSIEPHNNPASACCIGLCKPVPGCAALIGRALTRSGRRAPHLHSSGQSASGKRMVRHAAGHAMSAQCTSHLDTNLVSCATMTHVLPVDPQLRTRSHGLQVERKTKRAMVTQ